MLALALLAALALVLLRLDSAHAQTPPPFELVAADYEVGRVVASVRTPAGEPIELTNISAFIDGVPYGIEPVSADGGQPLSIVLAIDVSGSMEGAAIAAAQDAAIKLVDRLAPIDRVAVIAFADRPQVLDFTEDRDAARSMISGLHAEGGTSLYDAVQQASEMLALAPPGPRIMVLLSDGEDDAGPASAARAASIAAARASGARMYSFGLGAQIDGDYLAAIADQSGGTFSLVADDSALGGVLLDLGERLGRTLGFNIDAAVLPAGTHTLTVRALVNGTATASSRSLHVVDEGMLRARGEPQANGADPMVIDVEWVTPHHSLLLQASAAGQRLPVLSSPDRVIVDPWRFAPGPLDVQMSATSNGVTVARGTATLTVPALRPMLDVRRDGDGEPAVYVAHGRVQDDEDSTLVALVDGVEVARSQASELRVMVRPGVELDVRLEDGSGALMAMRSVAAPAGPGMSGALLVLAGGVGVAGSWLLLKRRRRRRKTDQSARRLLRARRGPLLGHLPPAPPAERGTLLVRAPDGSERRYPLGPRPLSLGRARTCDVVIDNDGVCDLHARLSALNSGEFQVHAIAPTGGAHRGTGRDEWTVVRAGEQLAIGGHVLTVLGAAASEAG